MASFIIIVVVLMMVISFRSGRQSSGKLYFHPADVIPPGPDFHFQVSFDEDDDVDIDIGDIDIDSRMIRKEDIFNGDNLNMMENICSRLLKTNRGQIRIHTALLVLRPKNLFIIIFVITVIII